MTDAPDTAAEAAERLSKLAKDVEDARSRAKAYGTCAARAENLYRREKSKALIDPSLDGRNQAIRDAKAHEWKLAGEVRQEAAEVATAMGLDGFTPQTVGDLRWLRDRADGLEEASSAAAYDARSIMSGYISVVSWAKLEFEQTHKRLEATP